MLEAIIEWVWERHHNVLSWYIRPLFILPYCFFAYKRKLGYLVVTLLLFPTTLFWFPAPEVVSEEVLKYLDWEREFIFSGSVEQRIILLALIIVFLWLLALAFWKRSVLLGLLVLNIGTFLKVVWSFAFGGNIGYASILPSIVTLLVCNSVIYYFYKRKYT